VTARRPETGSGRAISALGFGVSGPHAGAWTRSGHTVALIERALELGVNVFDTAPFYGDGEAERRLGEALKSADARDVYVISKAGTKRQNGRWAKDFSPDFIRRQVEESLTRLGLDRLDALFLHGPGPEHLTPELLDALEAMKREALTASLGVCARGDEIYAALETEAFDSLMAPIHVKLTPVQAKRISSARDAGLTLFGIEIFSPCLTGLRVPRRLSDLRSLAKWAMGPQKERGYLTHEECLKYAVASGIGDCSMFTTTRRAHLELNVAHARALETKKR